MTNINKKKIEEKVSKLNSIQPWNHNYSLPFGIETRPGEQVSHGKNKVKWQRIKPILDIISLKNKTVLDIGCNEGFFSFQVSEIGSKVLGIDVDENRIQKALFIKEILNKPSVNFQIMDIYSNLFTTLPHFDICLCLGMLHRVPDPYTVIAKLTQIADIIIFEWKSLKHGPHDEPYAYYSLGGYNKNDYYGTQYWLMSFSCVEGILTRLGFNCFYRVDDPKFKRAILVAGKVANPLFDFPDIILHHNRMLTLLRHTKRYLLTILKIIKGQINA